jgi:hypothetical protein
MGRRRGYALVVAVCAVAVGVIVAVLLVTRGGDEKAPRMATSGPKAPLKIQRAGVPVIAGGIPVDLDPVIEPQFFSTSLAFLPGKFRYRITIANASSLGVINAFQWFPPTAVHIVKVLGSSTGNCTLQGLTGFGGKQFPGLVLNPNVVCDQLALKPPSCTCRGDGGAVSISFATDKEFSNGDVNLQVRAATVQFNRVPIS